MTTDYTKSLEETILKQERIIEDLIRDRDKIGTALGKIHSNLNFLHTDVDGLANPLNPGRPKDIQSIRDILKTKLHDNIARFSTDLIAMCYYTQTDPSDYVVTGNNWKIPNIIPLKIS